MPRFLPTDGQGMRTTPRASAVVKPGKRKVAVAHSAGAWELDYLAKAKGRGFAWCRTTKTLSGNCAALPQYLPDRPAVKAVLLARTLTEVVLSTPRSKCQPDPEQWVVSARPNKKAATCAGTPLGASTMTFAAGSWRSGAPCVGESLYDKNRVAVFATGTECTAVVPKCIKVLSTPTVGT